MTITTLQKLQEETVRDIEADLEDWGFEHAAITWEETVRRLASCYSFADRDGKPVSPAAAKILVTCRRAWEKGQRDAK